MKTIFKTTAILATFTAAPAFAAPYCDALTSADTLPKKYAKRGPFHSDTDSGWIVGQDQLKAKFKATDEVKMLWKHITSEFAEHGMTLSVMSAPPRPLFVPDGVLAQFGVDASAKQKVQVAYSGYIAALNEAGIPAPDLTGLTGSEMGNGYYFKRDTHWTPRGAAISAAYLKQHVTDTSAEDTLQDIAFDQSYEEKGSLSTVVEKVCGTRPAMETVTAATYAKAGSAQSLLGDVETDTKIALVGTSFSARYKRDAYQVADALAHSFDASVDNFALTGGGLSGSMMAFIQSGALRDGGYTTVVWETPYTTPMTDVHGLRQVLGALQSLRAQNEIGAGSVKLSDKWTNLKHTFNAADHAGLAIRIPGVSTGKLDIELIGADGEKQRVKLVKSDRIPADQQSDIWPLSLAELSDPNIKRIKMRLRGAKGSKPAHITLMN